MDHVQDMARARAISTEFCTDGQKVRNLNGRYNFNSIVKHWWLVFQTHTLVLQDCGEWLTAVIAAIDKRLVCDFQCRVSWYCGHGSFSRCCRQTSVLPLTTDAQPELQVHEYNQCIKNCPRLSPLPEPVLGHEILHVPIVEPPPGGNSTTLYLLNAFMVRWHWESSRPGLQPQPAFPSVVLAAQIGTKPIDIHCGGCGGLQTHHARRKIDGHLPSQLLLSFKYTPDMVRDINALFCPGKIEFKPAVADASRLNIFK